MTRITCSVSQLAHAFKMARETVSRKLADAKVEPIGKRSARPRYDLRDCVRALVQRDADQHDPFRRKAAAQAEALELRLGAERGEYIAADDVRETYAAAFVPIRRMLETLSDVLERDAALTPAQVARVERAVDELRHELADELGAAR